MSHQGKHENINHYGNLYLCKDALLQKQLGLCTLSFYSQGYIKNYRKEFVEYPPPPGLNLTFSEAVFLVVCDPSMNEL
jgi:hypothetical protein